MSASSRSTLSTGYWAILRLAANRSGWRSSPITESAEGSIRSRPRKRGGREDENLPRPRVVVRLPRGGARGVCRARPQGEASRRYARRLRSGSPLPSLSLARPLRRRMGGFAVPGIEYGRGGMALRGGDYSFLGEPLRDERDGKQVAGNHHPVRRSLLSRGLDLDRVRGVEVLHVILRERSDRRIPFVRPGRSFAEFTLSEANVLRMAVQYAPSG